MNTLNGVVCGGTQITSQVCPCHESQSLGALLVTRIRRFVCTGDSPSLVVLNRYEYHTLLQTL